MSTIITRNSANSGSTPASLVQGELAINVTDNRLFFGSGSGNVVKEFGVTSSYALQALSASYAISASYEINYETSSSYADFAVSASHALTASFVTASSVYGPYGSNSVISASYAATASSATNAQDILIRVLNQSGTSIAKGLVVHITASGNSSDIPRVITASYENDNNSANTLGIANETIANGAEGFIMTEGVLKGIDTSAFTSGQLIYLGATGSIIGHAPVAPLHAVRLGQVVRVQSNNGSIYVRIDNGYELDELHNVFINTSSISYGDLLMYSSSLWINSKQLSGSYGLTGSLNATSFTGSLLGTASYAAQALSASYAPDTTFPYTGSAIISGSLTVTGSLNLSGLGNGSVLFATGSNGAITGSSNLFWDNTNSRLGIGTASPSASLHISGASSANLLRVDSPASSSILFVSGSGNVGIGTNNPSARFSILGAGTTSSTTSFLVQNSAGSNALQITNDRIVKVYNGLDLSGWYLYANGTSNASMFGGTSWIFDTVVSGGYRFRTAGNTDRLRIESTGNVLINTTTDAGYKLDVNGTARVSGQISLTNGSALIYPPIASTAQEGLAIYRGASTSTKALTIGITNTDEVIFNTTNADYIFNRSGTEVFNIGGGGTSIIRIRYFGSFQQAIPTGTTINFCFGTSNTSGGQRLQFGFDSNEDSVIGLRNSSLRIRQTVSNYDFININATTGNVVIEKNTSALTPIASAKLAINSTTEGFLPPRTNLTSNISTPAQGLMTYITASATEGLYYYSSGSIKSWTRLLNDTGSQVITGSLNVTAGITGSLLGTASFATQALSASYAPSTPAFPYTGSAEITGSLGVTGSFSVLDSIDATNKILIGSGPIPGSTEDSVNWDSRTLFDSNGNFSVRWGALRTMYDVNVFPSIDWDNRQLKNSNGNEVLNWQSGVTITGSLTVSGSSTFTNIGPARFSGSFVVQGDLIPGSPPFIPDVGPYDAIKVDDINSERKLYGSPFQGASASIDFGNRELLDATGQSALSWGGSSGTYETYLYNQQNVREATRVNLYGFNNYAGQILGDSYFDATVVDNDLVYLNTDGQWYQVDQTTDTSTKMLGIAKGIFSQTGSVVIEGDVVVSIAPGYPIVDNAGYGLPIYIKQGAGTSMDTTVPASGYVRIVGHCYWNSGGGGADEWIMKFRPSNDWYVI